MCFYTTNKGRPMNRRSDSMIDAGAIPVGAGPSQQGGYQPVQGMSHHGAIASGSAHMGGRNNPWRDKLSRKLALFGDAVFARVGPRLLSGRYDAGRSATIASSRGGASRRSGTISGTHSTTSGRSSPGTNPPTYMSGRGGLSTARSAPVPERFARNRNAGNRNSMAHSELPFSRFTPDNVRRRPSPPPLHRRR